MPKIKGKKGNTPEHFDEFINMREVLEPDEYIDYWRGVNKLKKQHGGEYTTDFAEAWNDYNDAWLARRQGVEMEEEIEQPEEVEMEKPKRKRIRRIVRRSKGWATRDAKKFGGRVVRVNRFGKRSSRGRHWKAIT